MKNNEQCKYLIEETIESNALMFAKILSFWECKKGSLAWRKLVCDMEAITEAWKHIESDRVQSSLECSDGSNSTVDISFSRNEKNGIRICRRLKVSFIWIGNVIYMCCKENGLIEEWVFRR